jgi:Chromo (CHRromatin Organisation MOdifier) domain
LLRPYIENEVYGNNYSRPLPKLLEGEEVYEVKTILKYQQRERGYQYYVKWKGYSITKVTWENKSTFKKKIKGQQKIELPHLKLNKPLNKMATSTQTTLSVIKDEFAEVITEGTLSPTNKPSDWNVVITEKTLLNAMRTPSPPPEEIQHGLAMLYNTTFPTAEDYQEFTVNHLALWGNTLEYRYFDTMYMAH